MTNDMTLLELKDALSQWRSGERRLVPPTPEALQTIIFMNELELQETTDKLTEDPTWDQIGVITRHLITIRCVKYCLEHNVQF